MTITTLRRQHQYTLPPSTFARLQISQMRNHIRKTSLLLTIKHIPTLIHASQDSPRSDHHHVSFLSSCCTRSIVGLPQVSFDPATLGIISWNSSSISLRDVPTSRE